MRRKVIVDPILPLTAMLKLLQRSLLSLFIIIGLFFVRSPIAIAQPQALDLSQVVREIESVDTLRSTLSANLNSAKEELNSDTEVCQLVAKQLDRLSCEKDWQVKQVIPKYRNPENAPISSREELALKNFEKNPKLMGFWERDSQGNRYSQRINIEASCLACHGANNNRPLFIKQNYPHDLAYDFQEGDLAGMYLVWIPQVKGIIQDVIPNLNFCQSNGDKLAMQSGGI